MDPAPLIEAGEKPDTNCPEGTPHCPFPQPEDNAERRYLIRHPQALQYFHRGVFVKKEEKERVSGSFELFFDLLYVALIANLAESLFDSPDGFHLVVFLLTFTPIWYVWADAKENANNYYSGDLVQRCGTLWIMSLLILYGNNATSIADPEKTDAEQTEALRLTVGVYIVIRATQALFFAYYSVASHFHRLQNRVYVVLTLCTECLWIPLFFEEVSNRAKIAVAVITILCEEGSYFLSFGPWFAKWFDLEFRSALDIGHENDRYTAFTIIVLGEFTYGILAGSPASGGINLNYLRAVWTLVIAFCFNSMYVYGDGAVKSVHPARRAVFSAFLWMMVHLPISAGLLIGGHACAGATKDELDEGQRWLLGGGLGAGYLGLYVMAVSFKDEDARGTLMLSKYVRLAPRLLAAVVVALLPLADAERLDDTAMLSTIAGISAFVVLWEMIGSLERFEHIVEPWR